MNHPQTPQSGGKKNRTVKRHKRPVRGNDGKFHIKGKKYAELFLPDLPLNLVKIWDFFQEI